MTIQKAEITIIGKKPILFHNFHEDCIPLKRKEQTGVAGNDPLEWKKSVLKTSENQLYVEPTYIFGCMRDGARFTKAGRGTLQPKLASTLTVLGEIILLENRFLPSEEALNRDLTQPVYLDVRAVKNPNTKGRNIRYRIAASPGWKITFQIEWEGTIVNRLQMEAILGDAGSLVGLGDGRAIGFGRFDVKKFNLLSSN